MENIHSPPFHIEDDSLLANIIDYIVINLQLETCFRYDERYN